MSASQWLEVLASYFVQVLIVIALDHVLDRKTNHLATRSTVLTTCFLSVLCLGFAAVALPRLHLVQPWAGLRPRSLLTVAETQVFVGRLLVACWLIGAAVVLVRWLRRAWLVQCILRRSTPAPDSLVEPVLSEEAATGSQLLFSHGMKPRVLVSSEVDGPFCWQLHRPTVVLPRFLLHGSRADVRHVLLHEFEHLRINHPMQLFLQHAVQMLCWFNPLVWRLGRQASLVREFACDDAAAREGKDCAAYLRTLLAIAEKGTSPKALPLAFGRTRSEVVLRARRLVERAQHDEMATNVCRQASWLRIGTLAACVILASQVWLPLDWTTSGKSMYSPWPTWSARVLHTFGIPARDFDEFDGRLRIHELREDINEACPQGARKLARAG